MSKVTQTIAPKSTRQGTVTQRSKGSFQLRYSVFDAHGRRKQVNQTVRGTKTDAERVLRERLTAGDNGSHVDKSKETIAQYMARWLDTYVATNVTVRTAYGYQGHIKRYINPTIGSFALQSLMTSQVQKMYSDMIEGGLSHTTVLHTHRVLREALGHAVEWGIVTRNVAVAAKPPRRERTEMPMWDAPTIHHFLNLSHETRFGHIFDFAVHTGLRRSEICGLRWNFVDLEAGNLSVVATL